MTVRAFSARLESWFERNSALREIGLQGEISNLHRQQSGHLYFSLKDGDAIVSCFAYNSEARTFPPLSEGKAVIAYGRVGIRAQRGQYQLLVKELELTGLGKLFVEQERLKAKLQAEGLFEGARRRPMPRAVFSVALVSKRGTQGEIDFRRELERGAPQVRVHPIDTPVQGLAAAPEIAEAIDRANRLDVDLIAVVRGGGSVEELFAFNCEPVVRAIVRSRIPVLTGIGHHADELLCELVADHSSGTPTAAARWVVDQRTAQLNFVEQAVRALRAAADRRLLSVTQRKDDATDALRTASARRIAVRRTNATLLERRLQRHDPRARLASWQKRLASAHERVRASAESVRARRAPQVSRLHERLIEGAARRLHAQRNTVKLWAAKLEGRDPEAVLRRGYAIVRSGGRTVRDATTLAKGALIEARLERGTLTAHVESTADGR